MAYLKNNSEVDIEGMILNDEIRDIKAGQTLQVSQKFAEKFSKVFPFLEAVTLGMIEEDDKETKKVAKIEEKKAVEVVVEEKKKLAEEGISTQILKTLEKLGLTLEEARALPREELLAKKGIAEKSADAILG